MIEYFYIIICGTYAFILRVSVTVIDLHSDDFGRSRNTNYF